VVRDRDNNIGYLAGFSGKLGNYTHIKGFVPPVFDLWNNEGFFVKEEAVLNLINAKIKKTEEDNIYRTAREMLTQQIQESQKAIAEKKTDLKKLKRERKTIREQQKNILDANAFEQLNEELIKQSLRDKHELRVITAYWQQQINQSKEIIRDFETVIQQLKNERKQKSNALQQKLFQQYRFLNQKGEEKNLLDIFADTAIQQPPAAAGDCAAPKLLQYAYVHYYHPIAMAEFWWGEAPKSEIRKHKYFYPACRGKCEPILGHMLEGLTIEDNPLLQNPALQTPLEIVFEDDYFAVINKPAEFLSVPGIYIQDSVYERMKLHYPKATGPLIVHRLDMATSGILIIAKDKESHKALQSQFIKKTVEKRYIALLDGILKENSGFIDLPLRVDLDDRPRQMVCHEYGKTAKTKWKVVERTNDKTKVYLYPVTGRTHQLRVHASHPLGLNIPITGDDLYGKKSDRLYLHAQKITFKHPRTYETVSFEINEDF
jgi:tRNA pseudouridine32 synthase/23S rRNA pseudouridine746 synthase